MRLRIRGHPAKRMIERGVTEADIRSALENFHTRYEGPRADSVTYIGPGNNGADLKVFVLQPGIVEDGATIIKSVAWRSEGGQS